MRSRASHQTPVIHGEAGFAYLEKEIKTDAALAPADIKDLFCKLWPDAKAAVDALEKIIKNPMLVLILEAVEAIGNTAQKAFCPKD